MPLGRLLFVEMVKEDIVNENLWTKSLLQLRFPLVKANPMQQMLPSQRLMSPRNPFWERQPLRGNIFNETRKQWLLE